MPVTALQAELGDVDFRLKNNQQKNDDEQGESRAVVLLYRSLLCQQK